MKQALYALALGTSTILAALTAMLGLGMLERGDLRGVPAIGIACFVLAGVAWAWRADLDV